jgi:hypothetical protein
MTTATSATARPEAAIRRVQRLAARHGYRLESRRYDTANGERAYLLRLAGQVVGEPAKFILFDLSLAQAEAWINAIPAAEAPQRQVIAWGLFGLDMRIEYLRTQLAFYESIQRAS